MHTSNTEIEKSNAQKNSFPGLMRKWLSVLGPGIITAALVFGPSKMTITSKLGAEYGYDLLWIVVVAIFFMTIFTSMAARIGAATRESLLSTIREKWGKPMSVAVGVGVFLVTASFQSGNSVGVGISLAEMTHTRPLQWIIIFNVLGLALLFFRTFYKMLEQVMLLLVGMMLFAFITTLVMSNPGLPDVARGLIPSVPQGSSGLVIAFLASTFSIVGAFYQSYLVQERLRIRPDLPERRNDSVPGILILGVMSAIVLICAAAVLHPNNGKVNNATDMAKALEPMFGKYAAIIFLSGLFAASFSSLIGNATVGGTLLSDALGYGRDMNSKIVRALIALVMVIGATIAVLFGKAPLELIVIAQSITIFVVPLIGIAMYSIANDVKVMGSLKNTVMIKVFGGLGLLIIISLALVNMKELFF